MCTTSILLGALCSAFTKWKKSNETNTDDESDPDVQISENATDNVSKKASSTDGDDPIEDIEVVLDDEEGEGYGLDGYEGYSDSSTQPSPVKTKPATVPSLSRTNNGKQTSNTQPKTLSRSSSGLSGAKALTEEAMAVLHPTPKRKAERRSKKDAKKLKLAPARGNQYSNITVQL